LSGRDRFIAFVEKANTTLKKLREGFIKASDHETATSGTRHTPPATPVGEGLYAIINTGRESHIAYMLTIPEQLGEVQKDVGLREKGSFVISIKNPEIKGPPYASLPRGPDYPKE